MFLRDGAALGQGNPSDLFLRSHYVLDGYHLRRALHQALQHAQGELGTDYVAAAYITLKNLLWFGELGLTLQRLDRLRSRLRAAQARDAITELKRYILNNRVGIGYADLYEQGIHVGSGLVEKAADLVTNRRCELQGMTWYRGTANGICNLRALLLNPPDRWYDFWLN